jgi:pyruvate/2-oxoglutarate dehydrogenase complex dihydrolipoamide dehydrogenase (E3) component
MSQVEQFDMLILGSGQGGKRLAWHFARSGRHVAVIERQWVGGSCPAVACLPSKNEIWGARVAHLAQHAAHFGTVTGAVKVDMEAVRQRKRDMVEREIVLHRGAYKASGAELIMGSGRFVSGRTLEVQLNAGGQRILSGADVVINVGSHAAIPAIAGLAEASPLTHIEALELAYVPTHLIVLGGGYIGLEMAQAFRRFGSRVTIVEYKSQLVGREDPDVADEIHKVLTNEGIECMLGTEVIRVDGQSGKVVELSVRTAQGESTITGSDLLVAAGRIPNTAGIGLELTGVEVNDRGHIRVNDRLQTTAENIWAIGEAAGSPHFTHVSVDDFRVVRDNVLGGQRSTAGRLVPYTLFTDPPLAHVGLNEREACEKGIPVRVAKLPMGNVLRTFATDESTGFMKVLVNTADDRIVGFTMVGSEAGEVLAAVQTAMLADLPYPVLRDAVISHLTVAEGLNSLFAAVPPRAAN